MSLKTRNVLFLDLQTTGAKPPSANILEISWASSNADAIESHLIKQTANQPIPGRIQLITGITQGHMIEANALPEILQRLANYLQTHFTNDVLAIIHFAQFEKPFLFDAFEQIQKPMPFTILCTHEIAKRLLPNLPARGIKGLAGYFGVPSGELKRAANHVQATKVIWKGLIAALEERNIHTHEELKLWMQSTPKPARVKYEYPLPKEKRLGLPKQPGIYRMLSKWGEVLYVGKATSLYDRVNSYFRGQKNRDSRKLEMLTQVWDIQVTPVGSPLEAALLETDEIKRLNPPYNISLKTGHRNLAFFNDDFTSVSTEYDDEHMIGPFSNALALDSVQRLSRSLQVDAFDEQIFFEPLNPSLLKEGFVIFCARHTLNPKTFCSVRSILALGLNWVRTLKDGIDEAEVDFDPTDGPELTTDTDSNVASETASADQNESVELTPEDIADKFERHCIRAAKAYLRAKKLTKLLNSDIHFSTKNKKEPNGSLKIRQGQIVSADAAHPIPLPSWKNLSIDTYDRMTVLLTELEKLRSQQGFTRDTFEWSIFYFGSAPNDSHLVFQHQEHGKKTESPWPDFSISPRRFYQ
jgi:DNA polymerase-3 subunit epsilon